ncbi:BREX-1 system adenine-specific DNA-methyltransferase PglX [Clostridium algidicarnis]|uniref:site-specific DNA-methyltransferase (adenine-specific) n=1 Tax=Clostridium algidicarnis TaxID=37659 RepID=A0ABS6C225_9CLOT|nr:BREX-1 system adenine-specific DNA-methyltransferase PglX [Clostridium algidicarnis]MBU3219540.1 BREX-1 system adenine-specific DNA-methyltransferase PglX [Clostridium algidicarnis]
MDKNKIKSFAIWARRNLISAVENRARYIGIFINDDGEFKELKAEQVQGGFKLEGVDGVLKLSYKDREVLINRIKSYDDKKQGFEQVMEEVAYTWFNRFMGLRYMEVNEYLPSGIRVLSSEVEGKTEPDVLTRVSEVVDELKLNSEYIYELLDSGKTEDREEAYKHILVRQCNELGKIIPQMFEKISDYTELLLPDNLLEEGSVIRKMVEDIEGDDWKEEVEIIGWMYQYYISEKKDEVFAALKQNVKITKENIPAATQLFTPKWIVKYMVENSLGRLWLEKLEGDSEQAGVGSGQWAVISDELKSKWKYYLEEAEQEPEVEEELKKIREEHSKLKPQDIKVLDPCMGSGHILVYAFDVLYEIYKTAGYSEREIPRMILQNNLYGLDIDDRAAQLASFALIMKARHYNRRLFRDIERESLELNLCSIQESNSLGREEIDYFCTLGKGLDSYELRNAMEYLCETFTDAKEYGSILEVKRINFEVLKDRLYELECEYELIFADNRKVLLDKLPMIIKQAEIMSRKYEICVTNPPYMGNKGMNKNLNDYVRVKYPKSKSDLYTIMLEKCIGLTIKTGFVASINQHSWMFLTSYEDLRRNIIKSNVIQNMIHLGSRAFEEIGGEVVQTTSFVIRNNYFEKFSSKFIRAIEISEANKKEKYVLDVINKKKNEILEVSNEVFLNIPNNIIAYWVSKKMFKILENEKSLSELANVRKGLITSDNDRFLRLWHEVNNVTLGIGYESDLVAKMSKKKWFPYVKGGKFKKWYGNYECVLNYYNDGEELKAWVEELTKTKPGGRIINKEHYFKTGITWSSIGTSKTSFRYVEPGSVYSNTGMGIFSENLNLYFLIGFLNSIVCEKLLNIISPTMGFEAIYLSRLPIIQCNNNEIKNKVIDCYRLSKDDWDSFETSWDFKIHPLLKLLDKGEQHSLSAIFRIWQTECEEAFNQLKANEEELNRIFIDIYGLEDELTPEVNDKDITIRKADRERDIKSFISYAVGCMFGRYSLDEPGLIFAGYDKKCDEFHKANEEEKCKFRWNCLEAEWDYNFDYSKYKSFMPDVDNVIPITEDEYFEDDIVSRFIEFVRTVYGEETLEENLDFIADSIGRKPSETARQAIRRYFIKNFYKDHLKVYQKRPIYWMFESGKNDGFKALVYMHRYNAQTVAKVRTDYLHTLQRKYEAEMQRQQLVVDSEEYTAKDRTAAKKKIDRIAKQIEECREYDQVVAHLANEKISIDLDDGVKVNYEKFQGVKVINSKDKEVKMDLLSKI